MSFSVFARVALGDAILALLEHLGPSVRLVPGGRFDYCGYGIRRYNELRPPMQTNALEVPSRKTSQEAQEALRVLGGLGRKRSAVQRVEIRAEGSSADLRVALPKEAFELFLEVLGQMANGNAVTIMPVHAELTTQQAADLLNVSRPHVVALLEESKIAHRMVGTHRRIRVADLLEYKKKDDTERAAALEELASEAQKHDLGY